MLIDVFRVLLMYTVFFELQTQTRMSSLSLSPFLLDEYIRIRKPTFNRVLF